MEKGEFEREKQVEKEKKARGMNFVKLCVSAEGLPVSASSAQRRTKRSHWSSPTQIFCGSLPPTLAARWPLPAPGSPFRPQGRLRCQLGRTTPSPSEWPGVPKAACSHCPALPACASGLPGEPRMPSRQPWPDFPFPRGRVRWRTEPTIYR